MNVYDFDNTIYDGESCFDLFKFYIKKDPSLLRLFPTVVKGFRMYRRGEDLNAIIEKYSPIVELKLSQIDYDNEPREFWDSHMNKIKPFYSELQREDDLIITASPDFHIEEIARRLGIKHYMTSIIDRKTGKVEFMCIRQNKITAFREKYGDVPIENFYTDSPKNDAPLIELAEHAFVVDGNNITQIK
jgi:phosphoserine phosphatase